MENKVLRLGFYNNLVSFLQSFCTAVLHTADQIKCGFGLSKLLLNVALNEP